MLRMARLQHQLLVLQSQQKDIKTWGLVLANWFATLQASILAGCIQTCNLPSAQFIQICNLLCAVKGELAYKFIASITTPRRPKHDV